MTVRVRLDSTRIPSGCILQDLQSCPDAPKNWLSFATFPLTVS